MSFQHENQLVSDPFEFCISSVVFKILGVHSLRDTETFVIRFG